MLKKLTINNLAIIESNEILFHPGFNVITGETGAGKSLIVDAISLLSGSRADYHLIRRGQNKCTVTAEISIDFTLASDDFKDIIDSEAKELIITRELRSSGISRCFVNGSPIGLKDLKSLSTNLLDLHTQHSHHQLLGSGNYIDLLDKSGDYSSLRTLYKSIYKKLAAKLSELVLTKKNFTEAVKLNQYNKFVLNDIEKVNPKEGEDIEIKKELDLLENSEYIIRYSSGISQLMYDDEKSVFNNIKTVLDLLNKLADFDDTARTFNDELKSVLITAKEISTYAHDFSSEIEFNPSRIEQLRIRSQSLRKLYKRYGEHKELIEYRNRLQKEISDVEGFDDKIALLELDIEDIVKELSPIALELSAKRKEKAKSFSSDVTSAIRDMEMLSGVFDVAIETPNTVLTPDSFKANGIDEVTFMFSANAGEKLKPLNLTASGGEMSRLMVAIKSLSNTNYDSTIIFDEIDSGISGEAAVKVGKKIKYISEKQQVISISHLPQIAAKADSHIYIKKYEENGSTLSRSIVLEAKDKSKEIARLFAGENITDSALKSAEELISKSN